MDEKTIARFWAKVDRRAPDECWEWTAGLCGGHYGAFSMSHRVGVTAHRFSWVLEHGPISNGMIVRHRCDNKQCVNPRHLELGTPRENRHDWIDRGCKPATPPLKPRVSLKVPPASRFWSKVETGATGDCWPWRAGRSKRGYGQFSFERHGYGAHRFAFFLAHGRWPTACILHTCDNPPCCNPAHLVDGTHADNSRDMVRKGRQARGRDRTPPTARARGARHGRTNLHDEAVSKLRQRYRDGWTLGALAIAYRIGTSQAWRIICRTHWRHVK